VKIPQEIQELMEKFPQDLEKKMIEAYIRERTVDAIVKVANSYLREVEKNEA
jgi:hypothetical protein